MRAGSKSALAHSGVSTPTSTPATVAGQLLEHFQRGFPLTPHPYREIGERLGCSQESVTSALEEMLRSRQISRVGPVFRPNTIGASTLAAMPVPTHRLQAVAAFVSSFRQVNHNYQREHHYNLWFVLTARDRSEIRDLLAEIRRCTGLQVLDLPMQQQYHIDLGFSVSAPRHASRDHGRIIDNGAARPPVRLDDDERRLLAAIETGLSLQPRPYQVAAETAGITETRVIDTLERWLSAGIVRRLGLVARHHELGYRANAMVVWDIPDHLVDTQGRCLGQFNCVSLCYRRPRRPGWRYNLFCMVHGRDRDTVLAQIAELATTCGLQDTPHEVLFSVHRFKQTGARYAEPESS